MIADEVEFPPLLRLVVDGADLLDVLHVDVRTRLVFDEDVFSRSGVFLVVRALAETDLVMLWVVAESFLLPRHGAAGVFFVDAAPLVVVVAGFAVAGRVVPVVITGVPRVEGFSEFLQNPLTGLAV